MARVLGRCRNGLPVVVPLVQIPLVLWLVGWCGRALAGLMAAVFRRPLALTVLAGLVLVPVLVVSDSAQLLLAVLLGLVGAGLVWRWLHRSSFNRCVGWPLRSAWRSRRVYQRYWTPAMVTAGLAHGHQGNRVVPRLISVRSTGSVDRVTLALLAGQVPGDYVAVADRLAATFGVLECRVRGDPRWRNRVVLWMLTTDPLSTVVPPFEPEDPPNLNGLPVAVGEDGLVYRLRLLGTHLLLVGATGAGKGSVLWSLIRALSPGVRSGHVALWVVDPKGGMELAPGQRLFARFCHGTGRHETDTSAAAHEIAYAELLEDAVDVMRQRQDRLRGIARLHQPTPAEPLIVVVVDELASLTSYVTDRDAKKRIGAALSLLLSQGRAVGVSVVAALQDPRKEVLPARDLFPTRVALRLTDDTQVDMVLGDGARKRGAAADLIADSLPGVYLAVDGVAEPVRVRFSYLTDADITDTVETYTSPTAANGPGASGGDQSVVAEAPVSDVRGGDAA